MNGYAPRTAKVADSGLRAGRACAVQHLGVSMYMSENISKLLADMKRRPGVYFGKKSLERLATFLSGYMCCVSERDGVTSEYLPGFQEFIAERYNIRSAHHWSEIIRFFCTTDEEAFDEFYKLLDEFIKNNN